MEKFENIKWERRQWEMYKAKVQAKDVNEGMMDAANVQYKPMESCYIYDSAREAVLDYRKYLSAETAEEAEKAKEEAEKAKEEAEKVPEAPAPKAEGPQNGIQTSLGWLNGKKIFDDDNYIVWSPIKSDTKPLTLVEKHDIRRIWNLIRHCNIRTPKEKGTRFVDACRVDRLGDGEINFILLEDAGAVSYIGTFYLHNIVDLLSGQEAKDIMGEGPYTMENTPLVKDPTNEKYLISIHSDIKLDADMDEAETEKVLDIWEDVCMLNLVNVETKKEFLIDNAIVSRHPDNGLLFFRLYTTADRKPVPVAEFWINNAEKLSSGKKVQSKAGVIWYVETGGVDDDPDEIEDAPGGQSQFTVHMDDEEFVVLFGSAENTDHLTRKLFVEKLRYYVDEAKRNLAYVEKKYSEGRVDENHFTFVQGVFQEKIKEYLDTIRKYLPTDSKE